MNEELLHERTYSVRVHRTNDREMVARGTVHDVKPPGLYIEGDPDPLTMHHMTIELRVECPSLVITDAHVQFGTHPQDTCPAIASHYGNLVGLSIARGFTHQVRERFGGPRGCTHVTALLQAMAPALVQATWSMRIHDTRASSEQGGVPATDMLARLKLANSGTCHVWAVDGEMMAAVDRGESPGPTIAVRERLESLGRDPMEWRPGGR